jgi:eukaryotic-like serine/threonine-protein kinase
MVLIGRTISHYKILEKLGDGGMGVVYKAEDSKLHRTVALKFLRPDAVESRALKARLLTEAEAAAALTHPNICVVYEIDEAEGNSFIAMEYVEGESLADKIKKRPLPLDEALDAAIQVAEGLQAAHEKKVVHRDIKPANIMLDAKGRAKIMDFGLAHLEEATRITKTGTVLGTPAYMSPEQVRGEKVDHRTDIWSLGVVLYEMSAGQLPFRGEIREAISHSILYEEPEPLTAVRTGVPQELERIVAKTLAKNPAERYQHLDEVLVDLRSASRHRNEPESSREGPRSERKRVSKYVSVLVVAVSLFALGLYLILGRWSGVPRELSIAVLPLDNLSGDPDQEFFSDGMTDELTTQLAKIGSLHVISPTSAMRFRESGQTLPEIARQLGVSHIISGSVRRYGGQVRVTARLIEASADHLLWTDSYQREERDVLSLQEEVARAVAREVDVNLTPEESDRLVAASEVDPIAHEAYLKGIFFRKKWTAEGLQQAMRYFEQAIAEDPSHARAYAEMVHCYLMAVLGGAAPGSALIPKAIDAAGKALQLDPSLAEAHAAMGKSQAFSWNWQECERYLRKAIELNPGLSSPHASLAASCLAPQGRIDEALEEIDLAVRLDPLSVRHHSTRGGLLRMNRQYDESFEALDEALNLDPNDALTHMRRSANYTSLKQWQEALESMEKGRELGRVCQPCMAMVVAGAGDEERALELLRSSNYRPPAAAAEAFMVLGDTDRAFEALEQAYRERDMLLAYLKVYEVFDPLRSDPRYPDLLRRLNLEP